MRSHNKKHAFIVGVDNFVVDQLNRVVYPQAQADWTPASQKQPYQYRGNNAHNNSIQFIR